MRLASIKIWILALLSVQIVHTAVPVFAIQCKDSVIELNQEDPRLDQAGLFDRYGESQLCGPACIIKALGHLNLIDPKDPVDRLIEFLKIELPSWGINQVPENGIKFSQIKKSFRNFAIENSYDLSIETVPASELTEAVLLRSNSPDTVIIIYHRGWATLDSVQFASASNFTGTHYSVLKGVERSASNQLKAFLDDPWLGNLSVNMEMVRTPEMPFSSHFRLNYQGSGINILRMESPDYIRLMSWAIVIKKKEGPLRPTAF